MMAIEVLLTQVRNCDACGGLAPTHFIMQDIGLWVVRTVDTVDCV
ncbi:MAG: hypothetical protein V7L31_08345 [Nostoc sp.]